MNVIKLAPIRAFLSLSIATFPGCGIHPSDQAIDSAKTTSNREVSQPTSNDAAACNATASLNAVTAVINSHCVSCHGADMTLPDLSSSAGISSSKSAVIASVSAGRMPPSAQALSAADKSVIIQWGQAAPSMLKLAEVIPTYEGTVKAIFGAKCVSCHSATAPANQRQTPYLTTYAQVKAAYAASIQEMNVGSRIVHSIGASI